CCSRLARRCGNAAGQIGWRVGPGSGGSDRFRAVIKGRGGHAARPQKAVDPVVIAAQTVLALQTLVSRETDPMDSAVLSTTAVHAGEAFNVIPDTAELRGTVRTIEPETRARMEQRVPEVINGVASAMGRDVDFSDIKGYPSPEHDPDDTK